MIERVRFPVAPAPLVRRSPAIEKPCPCGCGKRDGMCEPHRERLQAVRDEMFGGKGRYGQRADQRGYRPPACCNPSCGSRRPRGSRYCVACIDEGWEEPE